MTSIKIEVCEIDNGFICYSHQIKKDLSVKVSQKFFKNLADIEMFAMELISRMRFEVEKK